MSRRVAAFSKDRAHDWGRTLGCYVGVAPEYEDEDFDFDFDFDFEKTMRSIHIDLTKLNEYAARLAAQIARNFEELGV